MRNRYSYSQYIWEREEWPRFEWDAERLLGPLGKLSHAQGQLSGRMSMLGFSEQNHAMTDSLASDLINSSEIEGVRLNPESVRSSIARRLGIESDGLQAEDHYVEGLVDVMLDAVRNCNQPLTAERLFDWHAALFPTGRSGMHKITVAGYRTGEERMQVVSGALGHEKVHYEAVPSDRVEWEMQKLLDWVNSSDQSPFIMAAVAHLWMVTIHPFDDGNGRISRTVADMLMSRLDEGKARYYSMSAEINRRKKEYYDVLERTQKGNLDITEWILWFFSCLEGAIGRAMEVVEPTLEKGRYWDLHHDKEVNERQRKVINRLWDGFEGKLTTTKWAKICGCSQDTALRDINDLISKAMLLDSGEGGRSKNYILKI